MLLKKARIDRAFDWIDLIYKVVFLIFGFFSFNSMIAGRGIMSIFVMLSTALAGVLLLYRLFNWRHFVHNVVLWILIAFLISYGISMALNYQYGVVNQLKLMVWMGMQFLLLFASDDRKRTADHKKVFHVMAITYLAYMFLACVISLIMLAFQYGEIAEIQTEAGVSQMITGFVWGRLWGVFTDPNYAATTATVAVLLSLYFFSAFKNVVVRIFLTVNIIVQVLYISFSDSRTGLVAMFLGVGVYFFCWLISNKEKIKIRSAVLRSAACVLAAAVVAGSCLVVIDAVKVGYNTIIISQIVTENPGNPGELEEETPPEKELVGREQDLENDFSNRRFDLWEASLEIIADRPVFGVSYLNLMQYTEDHFPENYLVNNDHGKFGNYHNMLFNIAAGQGLLGLAIFIAAGAIAGIKSIKRVSKEIDGPNGMFYIAAFSVAITLLASSMFVSELVYVNSANATIFWYLVGLLVAKNRNEVKENA